MPSTHVGYRADAQNCYRLGTGRHGEQLDQPLPIK
jgi:hypothetical protein